MNLTFPLQSLTHACLGENKGASSLTALNPSCAFLTCLLVSPLLFCLITVDWLTHASPKEDKGLASHAVLSPVRATLSCLKTSPLICLGMPI